MPIAGADVAVGLGPASNPSVASLTASGAVTAGSVKTNGAIDTSSAASVASPAVTSGTAFTPSATTDSIVTYQLTAAAAGSYTVTMGPTTGAENTLANAAAVVIGESVIGTIYVPKGWKVVITVTTITIAQVRVLSL